MVKRILGFFEKEIEGLHEAAYLLAIFAFSSQILALVRDRLLAGTFGASEIIDVYYASFRIPDLLYVVVTSFISASVLIPYLSKHVNNSEKVQKIIKSLFTLFLILLIVVSIVILIFTENLLQLFVPEILKGEFASEIVLFTRILLLSPLLLGVSQLFGSIVQAYRKFFVYAISPLLYNVGIILGIVLFYPIFGPVGLIYGVVLGLVFHVLIQLPTVAKHKALPVLTTKIDWKLAKEIILTSLPRTLALASSQITLLVLISLASTLAVGSIAIFNFAYNLQSVPLAIIGVSYSLAAFPTLSRLFASGENDKFLANLIVSAKHIIFWSFPVIVMFIVLRAQIVRTILGSGSFDWNDTRLTAAAFAMFAVSVICQNLILLFLRGYYSAGETRKPLLINLFSTLVTVISAFVLVNLFNTNYTFQIFIEELFRISGIAGSVIIMLPMAFSIGMFVNTILLWFSFEKSFKGFSKSLWCTLVHSLFASLIGGYVSYGLLQLLDDVFDLDTLVGIFSQGFIAGILGLAAWVLVLKLLGNNELEDVWKTMHAKIWKAKPVVSGQREL